MVGRCLINYNDKKVTDALQDIIGDLDRSLNEAFMLDVLDVLCELEDRGFKLSLPITEEID